MLENTPLKPNSTGCSTLSSSKKLAANASVQELVCEHDESFQQEQISSASCNFKDSQLSKWDSKKTYLIWLLICFSTGPTAAMMRSYVPATIQTTAHALGHPKGSSGPCLAAGDDCYVTFGYGTVQYTSYSLYLKAIYTSLEGTIAILMMAFADYSDYRKWLMIGATASYGVFAIPFYWLSDTKKYQTLVQQSVLYCLMLCFGTIYQITESSYIPVFMNARKLALQDKHNSKQGGVMLRGVNVSTWGLVVGNIGGIIASLVGVIITHATSHPSNKDFLLAVTVAGFVTTFISIICANLIPSLKGKEFQSKGMKDLIMMPLVRFKEIFMDLLHYREAFKFCVGWVLWNIAYSNFLSVFGLLFRSTMGIGTSDAEFAVWQFMNLIVACLGPLCWMTFYSYFCSNKPSFYSITYMKRSLYAMLLVGIFTNFWGCLGANLNSNVGFKYRWEFWLFQILFVSTSSGIRTINRVAYSAMLPTGKENQYFGFEVMLGLCTGWSESLIVALLQDKTGNSRIPFIPNTILYLVALLLFLSVDVERGMKQVGKCS